MGEIEKISLLGDKENGPHKVLEKRLQNMKSYHQDFKSLIASLMLTDALLKSDMLKGEKLNLRNYFEDDSEGTDYDDMLSFLNRETKGEFQYLTNNGIIKLFSYLEETIRSLIISIFKIEGNIQKIVAFQKIKLNVDDFFRFEVEEFYEYLYSKYQLQVGGERNRESVEFGYGVDRFENQLKPLGLSGKVEKLDQDNIYELIQLRHCIAHRDSIADLQFIKRCPQLNFKVGDTISIPLEKFSDYQSSVYKYLLSIISRLKENVKN